MINNLYIKATPTTASVTWGDITGTLSDQTDLQSALDAKQATLVSGTNIKTINSTSLLGSGNVAVEPTITAGTTSQYYRGDKTFQTLDKSAVGLSNVDNTSDVNKPVSTAQATAIAAKQNTLVSGTNIKTINSTSLLGSGDIVIGGAPAWLESNATDLTIWNNGKGNIVSNTSFGDGALKSNTSGSNNTILGRNASDASTTAQSNVAIGSEALGAATTGSYNVAIGRSTMPSLTTASSNVAIGYQALPNVTTGGGNIVIGDSSGYSITTNILNVCIYGDATGDRNIALSGATATANYCIAMGLGAFASGDNAIAIGGGTSVGADSVGIGNGATASGPNQIAFGSSGSNLGTVGFNPLGQKYWEVIINGVTEQILLA